MGLEIKTRGRHKRQEAVGRLHLDSRSLTFRGGALKWSVMLGKDVQALAQDGWLMVRSGRDSAEFEVGPAAGKWVEKILNPPSRLEKLGVKAGMKCWLGGKFPAGFRAELRAAGVVVVKQLADCQLAFLHVRDGDALGSARGVASQLPAKINLWIVWPKGVEQISQADVMTLAKACGLGPSKTAAFDDEHASMRYAKK